MKILSWVGEQFSDLSRSLWPSWGGSALRSWTQVFTISFWSNRKPQRSVVNYDFCRRLYRSESDICLGTGFAKPIVDLQTAFIGIPVVNTENEATNDFLNECINVYWLDEIQQMLRDSIRDSKVVVRIQRPDILDPLMTLDEAEHCTLEIIPPEFVTIEYDPRNKRVMQRAIVTHTMLFVKDKGNPATGQDPTTEEHTVLEIIDQNGFRFWDQNDNVWLTDLQSSNRYGFVPLLEVFNEWDASLQSGQSDYEAVLPFMEAFAQVLQQGLQAHKYHSTPKVVMKLQDVAPFIKNNFPEAVDQTTGEIVPHAEISWRGREILFLQQGDEMAFLEARSVLGDTTALLEFLIDCICIAAQTPEWAFMRVASGTANSDRNAQTVPFLKKIDRKRRMFQRPIQELLKMVLVMSGDIPVRANLAWEMARPDDLVVHMQAFQQLVMGLEVALASGEISDETYMRMIKEFLPAMKSISQEKKDADADKAARQAALPQVQVPAGLPPAQISNRPPPVGPTRPGPAVRA